MHFVGLIVWSVTQERDNFSQYADSERYLLNRINHLEYRIFKVVRLDSYWVKKGIMTEEYQTTNNMYL
jgi:hypothetical protein